MQRYQVHAGWAINYCNTNGVHRQSLDESNDAGVRTRAASIQGSYITNGQGASDIVRGRASHAGAVIHAAPLSLASKCTGNNTETFPLGGTNP